MEDLFLVKLQAFTCNYSNTAPWVFLLFYIAQMILNHAKRLI